VTEYFVQLWNYLSDAHFDGSDKIAPAMPHVPAGAQTIQIVRSVTPQTLTKKGETGILEAYRRAIHNARDFIYLENQYFTNKSVANALRNALKDRPELQLILLLNENPNVPSYQQRQRPPKAARARPETPSDRSSPDWCLYAVVEGTGGGQDQATTVLHP
jgi:phosphatidylserine/phosphatidylglycerophosphate/cardiolipin synthase-like enzyme